MYKIDQLDIKDSSPEELNRTRNIFENLKQRAIKKDALTEHEKDFFCNCIELSKLSDGNLDDYYCCENYKFKNTYLYYFFDLSGFGNYQKVKEASYYIPNQKEIYSDIEFLKNIAKSWNEIIKVTNHKNDELLNQISKETRESLKEFDKRKQYLYFKKEREKFELDKLSLLLQSKYIYCLSLLIFEKFNKEDFILKLDCKELEINEYSIIHILNRHYSQITKPNSTKSFHNDDFQPDYLNVKLKQIFEDIDKTGFFTNKPINKIGFIFKNVKYLIWVNERTKQVKGKGNIQYNRIETFYPVQEQQDLDLLNNVFELKTVNDDLRVYIPKITL